MKLYYRIGDTINSVYGFVLIYEQHFTVVTFTLTLLFSMKFVDWHSSIKSSYWSCVSALSFQKLTFWKTQLANQSFLLNKKTYSTFSANEEQQKGHVVPLHSAFVQELYLCLIPLCQPVITFTLLITVSLCAPLPQGNGTWCR